MNNVVILIPTYNPNNKFPYYVDLLIEKGFKDIVIVDDGSESKEVFNKLNKICKIVNHDKNRGKGRALKTGFEYILNNYKGKKVLTTDDDGQHSIDDIIEISSISDDESLYLGVRDFNGENVPKKRRLANKLTAKIFNKIYHQQLTDTQTGLRVIPYKYLGNMLNISGEKFEYEMNVLVWCSIKNINIKEISIKTIYNEGKGVSHYKALRDSYRIFKIIINGKKAIK